MDKNEIIFFAVAIMAYVICAFTLNIPVFVHVMFGVLLLIAFIIAIALKYQQQFENEKISKIFYLIAILMLIFYIITTISELWFAKTLVIDSAIFLMLFIITIVIKWFFEKKN